MKRLSEQEREGYINRMESALELLNELPPSDISGPRATELAEIIYAADKALKRDDLRRGQLKWTKASNVA